MSLHFTSLQSDLSLIGVWAICSSVTSVVLSILLLQLICDQEMWQHRLRTRRGLVVLHSHNEKLFHAAWFLIKFSCAVTFTSCCYGHFAAVIFLGSFHSPEVIFEQVSVAYAMPRYDSSYCHHYNWCVSSVFPDWQFNTVLLSLQLMPFIGQSINQST